MNPLGVDKVICLCLDKRLELSVPLGLEMLRRGWDYKMWMCGDGKNKELTYDTIDTNELPPCWRESTNYPRWHQRPNAYNAWKAHRAMMEYSIVNNYQSVLFLEDDAVLDKDFDTSIPDINNWLKDGNWDMVYLGNFLTEDYVDDIPIIKVDGNAGGWHAVAIKRNIFSELHKRFPPTGPYDWICQNYIQPNYNCYAISPPLIRQQGTFSYVEGHYLGRRAEDNYQ